MDYQHILKLTRTVRERPASEAAVNALVAALGNAGEMQAVAALIECWASVAMGAPQPKLALATLYCHLAARGDADTARALARSALDLAPTSSEAMVLFEEHALPTDLDELCDRGLAFLAVAPFHPCSPRIRVRLIDRLVEAGRYDEAMRHVSILPPASCVPPVAEDIARACATNPGSLGAKASRPGPDSTQTLDDDDLHFEPTARAALG